VTVIAFKDGVLASDTLISAGTTRTGQMNKIIKTKNGWLVGGAGRATSINELIVWAEAGMDFDNYPDDSKELSAILVDPKGKVFLMDEEYKPFPIKSKYHADGSGGDLALGAMEAGASAEEAVKIAIKYDTACGGAVQKVKLDVVKSK
jgi:20S proteasome alpha/beta subunit